MVNKTIENTPISQDISSSVTVPTGETWDVTIDAKNVVINSRNVGDLKNFDAVLDEGTTISADSGRISGFKV